MIKGALNAFWAWYERHYTVNITVSFALFLLQIIHLFWLTTNVVLLKLTGHVYLEFTGIWQYFIIAVDYLEIPALLSVSLVYIDQLRRRFQWSSVLYLVFLNSQWLHLFWITDEFVVATFLNQPMSGALLPAWLAWIAILIDYLELPVIVDTFRRVGKAIKSGQKIVVD